MSPRAVRAAIALGSNLGDRREHLERAVREIRALPGVRVVARSSWHETEPVGGPSGQGRFLNGALLVETSLGALELLHALQALETAHGRPLDGRVPNGPRTLDLDLLTFGDETRAGAELTLPHPRMGERAFVLAPLAEIAPELRLANGRSVREGLARLHSVERAIVKLGSPAEATAYCRAELASARTLGFVPTMGALHDGHLTLVERARRENDLVVASVFVNPLQFNERSDFDRYPRDFDGDARLLAQAGASMVFTGTLAQFFPRELRADGSLDPAHLRDPGPCALGLEGAHRPGHFAGVATIVERLFATVRPTRAYFGQKDYQQTLVVRDLARALGGPPIVVCPTVREPSGLARSSRNELLAPADRARAAVIHAALRAADELWASGVRDADGLRAAMGAVLATEALHVEYAALRDPRRWTEDEPRGALERAVALVAVRLGGVRLIDNEVLGRSDGG